MITCHDLKGNPIYLSLNSTNLNPKLYVANVTWSYQISSILSKPSCQHIHVVHQEHTTKSNRSMHAAVGLAS